jgi:LPS-assembly lipoprotein
MASRLLLGRRGLLGWPVLLALPGCGFHPIYASNGSGSGYGPARTGLGLISVVNIPNRYGQIFRETLQARFDHGDAPAAKRFDLSVDFRLSSEALGIQQDTTATRIRFMGQANWKLVTRDAARATVTSGGAHAVNGLNTFDQQYFAQDTETETVVGRMIDELADDITTQLAIYFDQHPA